MVKTSFVLSCLLRSVVGTNTTLRSDCRTAAVEAKCVGTAPFCGGNEGDCSGDWTFDKKVNGGSQTASNGAHTDCGKGCATGTKVVCKKCTPCVTVVKGYWKLVDSKPAGFEFTLEEGVESGESHTRTEEWSQQVTASAEAGLTIEDVFNAGYKVEAQIAHKLTQQDQSYWKQTKKSTEKYTFPAQGDLWQWTYDIEDGCGPTTSALTPSVVFTTHGSPCCLPGMFSDSTKPDSKEPGCKDGPNLCEKADHPTVPPTTPEPAFGPDACAAGAEFQCIGTAPFCGGNEGDCSGDWIFFEKVKGGNPYGADCGKSCATGNKALCYRCKPAPAPTPAPPAPETTAVPTPTTAPPETTAAPETSVPSTPSPETTPSEGTTAAPSTAGPETTAAPTTAGPESTAAPETTAAPTTAGPKTTAAPTTAGPGTTAAPKPETTKPPLPPVDPKNCQVCLTTCAPCEACTDGPDGSFALGSCKKCWQCWDYDDDELEDDDDDMDKDCDALHKDHDWDDKEVRCLHDVSMGSARRLASGDGRRRSSPSSLPDCRLCWASMADTNTVFA